MKIVRRILTVVAVAMASVAAQVPSARASLLSSHLTMDGTEDTIVDDSRSTFVGKDGFTVGDVVYGFAEATSILPKATYRAGGADETVAVIFSLEVKSVITIGTSTLVQLGPTTVAGLDLASLLSGTSLDPKFDPTVGPAGSTTADAIGVIVSRKGGPNPFATFTSVDDFVTNGYSYEATIGIDRTSTLATESGGGLTPGTGDFFHVLPTFSFGGTFISATELGGFSVFDHSGMGTDLKFLKVSNLRGDAGSSLHDVALDSALVKPDTTNGWSFVDQAHYRLNVVPEPASVTMWGVAVVGIAGMCLRRRRRLA